MRRGGVNKMAYKRVGGYDVSITRWVDHMAEPPIKVTTLEEVMEILQREEGTVHLVEIETITYPRL